MASPTGTALIPTQGSCLPLTDIVVFFPNLFIVLLLFKIDDVGLTANDTIISCPEEIPPSIPPALLELKFNFFLFSEISHEYYSPVNCAEFIPQPIFTPLTALILIIAEAISESNFE